MGSQALIDVIGSMLIGGFLLFMILNLTGTVAQTTFTTGNELTVQENLVNLVEMLESDFRMLGYCADPSKITDPTKAILSANRHGISFVTDLNSAGVLDTLNYSLDTTAFATATPNPRDRILYRRVNHNRAQEMYLGMTQFDFKYLNVLGVEVPSPVVQPKEIYAMQLSVTLESPAAYDTIYAYAFWRQLRLTSRNLRNR